mmetsp:Transcript_34529/g.83342  ORF Transcript_34529/g.83342 Transcript_34529/m.83342 type:complete len:536 (-) Transcript_34529:19-1626(-)
MSTGTITKNVAMDMDIAKVVAVAVSATAVVVGTTAATTLVMLLRRISKSVGVEPPTEQQMSEESPSENCPLFRHFPSLSQKLAWRSLGATKSTPVHICTLPSPASNSTSSNDDDGTLTFYVKREDLIHPSYGGNKVRTLQHQLGVLEARRDRGDEACRQIVSIGSGGSNQVIATVVHANKLGWDNNEKKSNSDDHNSINACWFDSDEPDLDNTLNMLSVLSFPNVGYCFDWGMKPGILQFFRAVAGAFTQRDFIPLMLGGNCTAGVFGQASGVIELAEQIERCDSPDIDRIYLPIGSGCTVSGLIFGTVIVKHLKMKAMSNPDFKIVGCNVHDGFAAGDRLLGLHTNPLFGFMPLTITHSVIGACRTFKALGGPDLEDDCLAFIKSNVEIRSDADIVGKYGGHSKETRSMARYYDEKGSITDFKTGSKNQKELWVCGHFVGKALHPLVKDLEKATSTSTAATTSPPKYLLWQTKSAIQPKGPLNEWDSFMKYSNTIVQKWANEGKAESTKFRPGSVNTETGKQEDYQSIMTKIEF